MGFNSRRPVGRARQLPSKAGPAVAPPSSVSAGSNASFDMLSASPCSLSGSATGATSYLWTKSSGPGTVTFADATALSTTCTLTADGSVVLNLAATNAGGTTNAQVTITVTATLSALLTRMATGSRAVAWWEVGVSTETLDGSNNFTQLNDVGAGAFHMTSSGANVPAKTAGGGPNGKDCMTFQDAARRMLAAGMSFGTGKLLYLGGVFKVSGGYSCTSGNNNSPPSNTLLLHAYGPSWITWASTGGSGLESKTITSPAPDASWHQFDTRYITGAVVVTRVGRVAGTPAFTGTGAAAGAVESITFGHGNGASGSGGCAAYCQWAFEAVTTTAGSACLSEQGAIDYYVTKQTAL